jgi:hypothetical protein
MAATVDSSPLSKDPARSRGANGERDRDEGVIHLVLGGASVREVGAAYGLATRSAMHRLVERALRSQLIELDPELRRRVREARLEALLQVWWDKALTGDPAAASVVLSVIDLSHQLDATARTSSSYAAPAGARDEE